MHLVENEPGGLARHLAHEHEECDLAEQGGAAEKRQWPPALADQVSRTIDATLCDVRPAHIFNPRPNRANAAHRGENPEGDEGGRPQNQESPRSHAANLEHSGGIDHQHDCPRSGSEQQGQSE